MKAQIVSFHCVLKNKLGQILSSSFNQDVINQLEAGDQKLRGLVAGIQNVQQGERRRVEVSASEGYGTYDPRLVRTVSRAKLAGKAPLFIGSEVGGTGEPGEVARSYRVTEIRGDEVVLDGNHPLAGHDLIFDIEVVSARDARQEDYEDTPTSGASSYIH